MHHWCSVGTGKFQHESSPRLEIFLLPLNTIDQLFFSHTILYLAMYCITLVGVVIELKFLMARDIKRSTSCWPKYLNLNKRLDST